MIKLYKARSLLYRRQILQKNIRWEALDEIYKICMLLHRSDLNISENRGVAGSGGRDLDGARLAEKAGGAFEHLLPVALCSLLQLLDRHLRRKITLPLAAWSEDRRHARTHKAI